MKQYNSQWKLSSLKAALGSTLILTEKFVFFLPSRRSWDSAVGIATGYLLDDRGVGD
jgi:hypothetical protein